MAFEKEFEILLADQMKKASGQRLEMLQRDKTGEKKLYCEVLRPTVPNPEGLILEHEIVSITGVKIYLDFYLPSLHWAVECLGFVPHAQNISRDRFDFEQVRVQTMAMYGMKYIPFSWGQLEKKSEYCRKVMFELLGRNVSVAGTSYWELSVFEREIIRYANYLNRPFNLQDVSDCTGLKIDASRNIAKKMVENKWIVPLGKGKKRFHAYMLSPVTKSSFAGDL